jgi:hypothetical protein
VGIAKPVKPPPPTDDRVRRDGGKSTDNCPVPPEHLEKIKRWAREHTRDEPGS